MPLELSRKSVFVLSAQQTSDVNSGYICSQGSHCYCKDNILLLDNVDITSEFLHELVNIPTPLFITQPQLFHGHRYADKVALARKSIWGPREETRTDTGGLRTNLTHLGYHAIEIERNVYICNKGINTSYP